MDEPMSAEVGGPDNEVTVDATRPEESPQTEVEGDGQPNDGEEKQEEKPTEPQEDRGIELPLGGERSPSHEDPGEERKEESEETFFTQ